MSEAAFYLVVLAIVLALVAAMAWAYGPWRNP